MAEESKAAGIYHFNFAKPSTVCEIIRCYLPPEKDRNYFAQLEACNTMGTTPEKSENLLPAEVTVQILGPLVITVDGRILEPCASARAAQLLKILALSIEPISIHKVVEAIWQNWEEKSAMSRRPGRIQKIIDVPLKSERNHKTLLQPEFVSIKQDILEMLWQQSTDAALGK